MHARLAETMNYVEEKRKELLQSFAGVPVDRLGRRPSTGGWSVAEILEHLTMVESGIARLITKRRSGERSGTRRRAIDGVGAGLLRSAERHTRGN